jgi:hypothetical protein
VTLLFAVSVLAWAGRARAADLTAAERAWLQAARPVLQYARDLSLPLDIVVQPQPTPGETPVGMAYLKGRCKLVLSMRGNPEAETMLARVEPALIGPVVEAIAAHELAHCWRHVSGAWGRLPTNLQDVSALDRLSPEHADLLREMWRTRREEGFADLVGLAWTLQQNPRQYEAVLAWNMTIRAHQPVETGPHDTRVWLRLAADRSRFTPAPTVFARAQDLWLAGMQAGAEP